MKLTFKDLKQQKFVIEAEPSETIADLKAKIKQEKDWDPALQKLIYSGKILQDDKTVESYNIEEKGFIVCMLSKPKPQAGSSSSAAAPPSTPAPASKPAQTPAAPAPAAAGTTTTSNVTATPSPAPAAQPESPSQRRVDDPSALALGAERNEAIANMEAMGFPRDQIDRAMRAAFFNPDRAVEYLLNGIPEHLQRDDRPTSASRAAAPAPQAPAAPATAPAPAAAATTTTESAEDEPINLFEAAAQAARPGARGAGETGAAGNLDFLRNNPQFQQIRRLVQQQPQMLEHIMAQLSQGNPQLAQLIRNSPDEFLELLAEDGEDDLALPPGAQVVSITEEERDAIDRLCRLGFERDLVIQAYFACDKNEELAANFLFDQPEDDEQ